MCKIHNYIMINISTGYTVIYPYLVRIFCLILIITSYTDEAKIILILNLENNFSVLANSVPPVLSKTGGKIVERFYYGYICSNQDGNKRLANPHQYLGLTTNSVGRDLIDRLSPLFSLPQLNNFS